ncbi:MAG TPA: selenide, water dikinase SelD, partial [Puia sp.]|nr:selenide, water dikinase SelD [Puia sp.]
AIAILGWPVNVLPAAIARRVIEGSRTTCKEAGIPLAGGHSIDSVEPIFGLAVNGSVDIIHIKKNNTAQEGDILFLTKKLGVGILTTAEKKGLLAPAHLQLASEQMMQLNKVGEALGKFKCVHAMTDVTGFGLLGHLVEMAEGSGLSALVNFRNIPLITSELKNYIDSKCMPGGTDRNWESYGDKIAFDKAVDEPYATVILADPQTSGGLLVAVAPESANEIKELLISHQVIAEPIGVLVPQKKKIIFVRNAI